MVWLIVPATAIAWPSTSCAQHAQPSHLAAYEAFRRPIPRLFRVLGASSTDAAERGCSTVASPINLLTNDDSELTGTRLQRPMLTDWSSPLAISS